MITKSLFAPVTTEEAFVFISLSARLVISDSKAGTTAISRYFSQSINWCVTRCTVQFPTCNP
jgi:hypothetical protein